MFFGFGSLWCGRFYERAYGALRSAVFGTTITATAMGDNGALFGPTEGFMKPLMLPRISFAAHLSGVARSGRPGSFQTPHREEQSGSARLVESGESKMIITGPF